MTQDKALQIYEASFYLDRALVNRALAVLSGNGDATSTVGAMLRDMERMALDLRRLHIENERLRTENLQLAVSARAEMGELRAKLALERDRWRGEIDREASDKEQLRTALRQILDDPEALILNSHRDDAWAALGEG